MLTELLSAVDLSPLTEEQRQALRIEAMKRGVSMPVLLGQLVDEISTRLLPAPTEPSLPTQPTPEQDG